MSVSALFDQSFYLTNNSDVVVAISQGVFSSAQQHYSLFGGKELRAPNSSFDANYYAVQNIDVLNAVSSGVFGNVFEHFQNFGESENRAPTLSFANFDATAYLAANTDVAAAVTAGTFTSALDHFISFGQSEARTGSGVSETGTTGSTLTLTTGIDNLTGTINNDTIIGTNSPSTISVGDRIDGGAGTDTYQSFASVVLPTLINVENIYMNAPAAALNVSALAGVTNLEIDSENISAGARTYTISAAQTLTLDSVTDTNNQGNDLDVAAAASVTAHTITLDGAGTASSGGNELDIDINGTGVATLNLVGANNASRVDVINTGGALTTLNLSGDQAITITAEATATTVTTINAAAATGAVNVNIGNANVAATGGSGADRFQFAASNYTSSDTVVGGDGIDTLALADATVTTAGASTLITAIKAATSVEKLENTVATGAAIDFKDVSTIDTFRFATAAAATTATASNTATTAGTDTLTLTGVQNDDIIEITANVTGGAGNAIINDGNVDGGAGADGIVITNELDGGANAVTISLGGGVTVTGGAGGALANENTNQKVSGAGGIAINAATVETLNIISTGSSGNTVTAGGAGATPQALDLDGAAGTGVVINTNGSVVVTGSANLNIGAVVGTNNSIDASAFTGRLTYTTEAGNNTVVGGSGNDTISVNGGTNTVTLGGGKDSIIFVDATDDTNNNSGTNIIADFTSADDSMSFDVSGFGTLNGGAANPITAANYFEGAIGSATAGTAYSVMLINDTGYASFGAFEVALSTKMTNTGDALVGFFNTTESRFELYLDNNLAADNNIAGADLVAAFTNITSTGEIDSAFANNDFIFLA
jgi:hypothetical protein